MGARTQHPGTIPDMEPLHRLLPGNPRSGERVGIGVNIAPVHTLSPLQAAVVGNLPATHGTPPVEEHGHPLTSGLIHGKATRSALRHRLFPLLVRNGLVRFRPLEFNGGDPAAKALAPAADPCHKGRTAPRIHDRGESMRSKKGCLFLICMALLPLNVLAAAV